jgi:hypothetical protein
MWLCPQCHKNIHRILSLPVEGETVKEKCPDMYGTDDAPCFWGFITENKICPQDEPCQDGFIPRPLTLGGLPERYRKMRDNVEMAKRILLQIKGNNEDLEEVTDLLIDTQGGVGGCAGRMNQRKNISK